MEMIRNSSVVPEGPDLVYHIVTIDWWTRWMKYVGVKQNREDAVYSPSPGGNSSELDFN